MITLKHRTASGCLRALWEYDPARRVVIVSSGDFEIDVHVACESNPRQGGYVLSRKSETEWQIAPARFVKHRDTWLADAAPFDGYGRLNEFLMLTHAPPSVASEMEALQ